MNPHIFVPDLEWILKGPRGRLQGYKRPLLWEIQELERGVDYNYRVIRAENRRRLLESRRRLLKCIEEVEETRNRERAAQIAVFAEIERIIRAVGLSTDQLPHPPALGEVLLLLFCPKNRTRYVMGCLEENFHEDIKSKGIRRAKLLYWTAVLRSIGPLLWVKVRRAGLIALLLELGRRWSGMS